MPQVTVYIREEDIQKWKAIEKKSEWLHNCINYLPEPKEIEAIQMAYDPVKKEILGKPIAPMLETTPFVPRPPDPETGYPCCLKAKPCKHWEHDAVNSQWVNSITGETKEIL